MSETCRGHLWEKIIVKLFASSWYIFLTYIYDARSHLHQMKFISWSLAKFILLTVVHNLHVRSSYFEAWNFLWGYQTTANCQFQIFTFSFHICFNPWKHYWNMWLLPVAFRAVVFKLLVWCGAEAYVSGLHNTLELLMMGIVVPETCWASNKNCNKNICCI